MYCCRHPFATKRVLYRAKGRVSSRLCPNSMLHGIYLLPRGNVIHFYVLLPSVDYRFSGVLHFQFCFVALLSLLTGERVIYCHHCNILKTCRWSLPCQIIWVAVTKSHISQFFGSLGVLTFPLLQSNS